MGSGVVNMGNGVGGAICEVGDAGDDFGNVIRQVQDVAGVVGDLDRLGFDL